MACACADAGARVRCWLTWADSGRRSTKQVPSGATRIGSARSDHPPSPASMVNRNRTPMAQRRRPSPACHRRRRRPSVTGRCTAPAGGWAADVCVMASRCAACRGAAHQGHGDLPTEPGSIVGIWPGSGAVASVSARSEHGALAVLSLATDGPVPVTHAAVFIRDELVNYLSGCHPRTRHLEPAVGRVRRPRAGTPAHRAVVGSRARGVRPHGPRHPRQRAGGRSTGRAGRRRSGRSYGVAVCRHLVRGGRGRRHVLARDDRRRRQARRARQHGPTEVSVLTRKRPVP